MIEPHQYYTSPYDTELYVLATIGDLAFVIDYSSHHNICTLKCLTHYYILHSANKYVLDEGTPDWLESEPMRSMIGD